jgi:predicted RNA-binding protein with EMAP domain
VVSLDTAKDARIIILEDALRRLHEIVSNRKLKFHIEYSKLGEILQQAGSLIYEVKYSYLPAEQVADLEPTKKIVESLAGFKAIVDNAIKTTGYKAASTKESLILAEASYAFGIVEDFQRKLREYDDEPGRAVKILAVEVSQTQPVPESKNLTECRCTDGHRIWRILTNLPNVKKDIILACAVLPPVEMMNLVSEAMFLGGQPLPASTPLGQLEDPPASVLDQARAQVLQIMKRMI